jgi:hypothetical protein
MPVRKFRSVEEMPGATWYEPGDPRLFAAMRRLWDMTHLTLEPRFPPGVHKNRSVEEMNARQDAWDLANHRALLERRR